jgi:hypothetical protein
MTTKEQDETPTTLAIGEEDGPTTKAVGEEEQGPGPTTKAIGEEDPPMTTLAIGEEGDGDKKGSTQSNAGNPFGQF